MRVSAKTRFLLVVSIAWAGPLVVPQRAACAQANAAAPASHRNVNADGIYLDDSFEAVDALGRLEPLVQAGRWRDAAELIQHISDRYGDKLIRRAPGYYVGLRGYVTEMITNWPPAGLTAYRALFERGASAAWERSAAARDDDFSAGLSIVERYFCTTVAFRLAEQVAQRAIERGDFALAEHLYRRLLDEHPDSKSDPARVRAMLAVVRTMIAPSDSTGVSGSDAGTLEPARKGGEQPRDREERTRPSELPADLNTRIRWKGQDRPLREVLNDVANGFVALRAVPSTTEWPVFAGNAERNRVARCSVDELGVQWRFSFERGLGAPDDLDEPGLTDSVEDQVQALTTHPVVSGTLVFVQRGQSVVAVRRTTGELVWRFGPDPGHPRVSSYIQDRPTGWDAVTVADGRVYAALPGEGATYYAYGSSQSPHELVCLDALSGRVIWRIVEDAVATPFANVQFDSSPIVEHGRLHIVGRRRRSFGFEDCYLFRLDAATGRLLSRTHVGSASTGLFGLRPATKAIAALHGDTVYVCSNLGSIAAVSPFSGAVRWVRIYERAARGANADGVQPSIGVTPWHYNPVVWSQQGLVVLPTDGDSVLLIAPDDGRTLEKIPLSALGGIVTLLGVHGGRLCGAGNGASCYDLASRRIAWSSPLPDGALSLGRGVWAGDRLFLPTSSGLSVFDVADGARTDLAWDPDGESGNLLALPDQLLVAGSHHLTAYVRKSAIWDALRARLAAQPTDPLPALDLAEVAMRGGETADALEALAMAVTRVQGAAEWQGETVRRRLFGDALGFARTLAERGQLGKDAIERLYDVASTFPTDANDHLEYRLHFAPLFRTVGLPARAVKLYEQVLKDRSLRALPVDRATQVDVRADTFCAARIDELINEHGAAVYTPFEREAAQLLDMANASKDEDSLARIVETYPNSHAAPAALVARGRLLARRGRPVEAVRLLVQAYHRYADDVDESALLKQIADTLESAGRREDAFRWLTKAALEHPSAVIENGDERFTFLRYRDRLNDVRARVEPQRARLAPPLVAAFERTFPAPMTLLAPRFGDEPGMRWSRAFVFTDEAIRAIDPVSGADLWTDPRPVRESVDLLIAREDVALFATSFEVFGVDPDTGRLLWSRGERPKKLDEPDADWEDADAIRGHALRANILATAYDGGRVSVVDIRNGTELWSKVLTPRPAGRIDLGPRILAYHALRDGRVLIGLVNAANGDRIDTIATDEHGAAYAVLQTIDEQVLLVTSQTVSAYDAQQRTLRWRVSAGNRFRETSMLLDVDALYLSPDGRDLRKISLEDGRQLWEVVGLLGGGEDDVTVERVDAQLIVSTSASVVGVDAVTGMILWRGTTPPDTRFDRRLVTRDFLVAINMPDGPDTENQAFFYDLRHASGAIPRDGAPRLGSLDDLRHLLAFENALLFQTGPTTIRGVAQK